ncbi:MAG: FtsW/RodA/SpoVE family cell cycle protein [Bacteroidales bacterium]|nr:FtsW/RodA/SpoVE family cell cycle protein [Bacteroidales bacterium]
MKDKLSTYFKGDRVIWIVLVFLSIISIVSVYSSIGDLAYRFSGGNTSHYLFRHLRFLLVGFIVLYFVHRIPYSLFFSLSQLFIIVAALLLIFTLFMGVTRNDATRWLSLPGIGVEFQTSDIAKFALIVYISRILSLSQENEESLTLAFKRIIIPVGIICGLILPSNFSTSFLLFFTSLVLMFIGRIPAKKLFSSVGILIGIMVFLVMLAFLAPNVGRLGTWKNRIESFWNDKGGDDYQANLAKTAIATSGLVGKGPGNSSVRYSLPQAYSDFIFAIILEEWGSLVGILVLSSYLFLLYRVGMIVKASSRTFPAFLAIGLTVNLVFQALANMAVAVNIVPVTGQPLPLVSMGGTSIISTFAALGVVLSISRSLEKQHLIDEKLKEEIN